MGCWTAEGDDVEERALYRAILAAPHDDTPRLVYADWLDENADWFPPPLAKTERARAEFIRLQCELARRLPFTRVPNPHDELLRYQLQLLGDTESEWELRELARRHQRLLFTQGKKWRRAFPPAVASARFDRGFLRPLRSFTPQGFLHDTAPENRYIYFPMLPPDSPARRYLPEDDHISHFPLWDLHLYGSDLRNDPHADRGQYGELLAQVGASPRLERVGTLQVSFFRTPCADFLRTGNFANVETLILNCGPFPAVLEAVAENESFRNLRYLRFGSDRWSWARDFSVLVQHGLLWPRIQEANSQHLPYGEMRRALRRILGEVGPMPPAPPPAPPVPVPVPPTPLFAGLTQALTAERKAPPWLGALAGIACVPLFCLGLVMKASRTPPPPSYTAPAYVPPKVPELVIPKLDYQAELNKYKQTMDTLELLRKNRELLEKWDALKKFNGPTKWPAAGLPEDSPLRPPGLPAPVERPVAPPPRPATPKD